MIRHCVLLNLRDDADLAALDEAIATLRGLVGIVPGYLAFDYGPNADYEGKSPAYNCGFIATFENRDALAAYDADPRHKEAGAVLVAQCNGGAAGIFVADLLSDQLAV